MNHRGFLGIGILAAVFFLFAGTNQFAHGCAQQIGARARHPNHIRMLFGAAIALDQRAPFPGNALEILYDQYTLQRRFRSPREFGEAAVALALDPAADLLTSTDLSGQVKLKFNQHTKQYVFVARNKILASGILRSSAVYPSPDELFLILAGEIQSRTIDVGTPLGTTGFVSPEAREKHWKSHGDEVARFSSEDRYEELAVAFSNSESPTCLSFEEPDGSWIKFDTLTHHFLVANLNKRGGIITYFRKRHSEFISLLLNVLRIEHREDPPPHQSAAFLPQWGQQHDVPAGSKG